MFRIAMWPLLMLGRLVYKAVGLADRDAAEAAWVAANGEIPDGFYLEYEPHWKRCVLRPLM